MANPFITNVFALLFGNAYIASNNYFISLIHLYPTPELIFPVISRMSEFAMHLLNLKIWVGFIMRSRFAFRFRWL